MATDENIPILNEEQISQKINRMAYEIYEQNFEEKHLVICGIVERGFLLAGKIFEKLKEITDFELELCSIKVDKTDPVKSQTIIDSLILNLDKKSVILCDDVLYTGKTLAYATIPFLEGGAKKLQCLVLIQRHHLSFPVQPIYVGMNLATTLQEHVAVSLNGTMNVILG